MKKTNTITSATIEGGYATVTYSTGTVRRYSVDKLPGTVRDWLDAQAGESTEEQPMEAVEEVGREEACTDKEEAVEAAPVIASQLPAPAPASQVATVAEAIPQAQPQAAPDGPWPLAWLAMALLDALTDAYYWATTWIPIGARRLLFLLAWDVLPVVRMAASRAARAMAWDVLPAMARGSVWTARAVVRASRAAARECEAIGAAIARAWAFRSDLIQEAKAA